MRTRLGGWFATLFPAIIVSCCSTQDLARAQQDFSRVEIQAQAVQGNIYMLTGAGDVYASNRYASCHPQGSIDAMIAGLNQILEMITPPDKQSKGGTALIPGHGKVTHQPELVAYRDMSMVIRDRIQSMMKNNLTLEQVKSVNPVKEY